MSVASEITRLQNAKASLKTSINAKTDAQHKITNETLENYSAFVDSITGGGGQTNIYRVPTIAQRNLINANENDMCVVADNTLGNWEETTNSSNIIFPEEVELSSAYMDWFDSMLRADQSSGVNFDGQISINQNEFRLDGWGDTINVRVNYYSDDGIIYTRKSIEAEDTSTGDSLVDVDTINLPFNVYIDGNWTDEVGYFMQTGQETFDGLFIYKNSSWQYAYVGVNTNAVDLFKGKLAYTNNGFVNGTLGITIDNNLLNTTYKEICECINNYQPANLYQEFINYAGTKLPITKIIDTTNVTSMAGTFFACKNLTSLDLSSWNTSNVVTLIEMFYLCNSLVSLNVSNWNTSKVTNIQSTFSGCNSLTSLDVSNWDVSKVNGFQTTFRFCSSLTSLDLTSWDVSSGTNFVGMFKGCTGLTSLDLSNFEAPNVTRVEEMFSGCTNLMRLDIRKFNCSRITTASYYKDMFLNVPNNCLIIVKDNTMKNWVTSKFSNLTNVKTPSEL